jgi:membrane protease YdiL (CAAX protease family)
MSSIDLSTQALGLHQPVSWPATIGAAAAGLAVMLAYSPIANWIATRLVARPPALGAFRALQRSRVRLVLGIVVAWVLGGFLEELALRGFLLSAIEARAAGWLAPPTATAVALGIAALVAGVLHLYQGLRAAVIITQLSALFGALFVATGHDLWAVVLCHSGYDTIAFIRFARKQSRYARLDEPG